MNNLLFTVMHKEYQVPTFSPYKSISVGPNKDKFEANYRDDSGDNIANKNSSYCTADYYCNASLFPEQKYLSIGNKC